MSPPHYLPVTPVAIRAPPPGGWREMRKVLVSPGEGTTRVPEYMEEVTVLSFWTSLVGKKSCVCVCVCVCVCLCVCVCACVCVTCVHI